MPATKKDGAWEFRGDDRENRNWSGIVEERMAIQNSGKIVYSYLLARTLLADATRADTLYGHEITISRLTDGEKENDTPSYVGRCLE